MAKYTTTFAADASLQKICILGRRNDANELFANAFTYGTFGSGTVTLFVSPDGGTTKIALKDAISGTAISNAAAAMNTIRLANGGTNSDNLILYATLAGSTNPALTVAIFDNL
jgi:hypothetical protein